VGIEEIVKDELFCIFPAISLALLHQQRHDRHSRRTDDGLELKHKYKMVGFVHLQNERPIL
jgi:hypothetical protein